MTMTDPIADMLTRIRNANLARQEMTEIPASRMKIAIAKLLKDEGYIKYFKTVRNRKQGVLKVFLRYGPDGERVISGIERISRPSLRRYVAKDEIPMVLGGMGVAILSTSKGLMTGHDARRTGIGGEVICRIW